MAEQYKRHPNTKCGVCGKAIYRRPVEIKSNKEKAFFSMVCYGVANRKEKPCVVCGKPIMSSLNKKTCGRKCSNTNRVGIRCIRYKIGRSRDRAEEIRAIKLKLFEKRGSKCERCGYPKREILQIHHKDRNTKNNFFSNLEIICPNCHYEEYYLEKSWLNSLNKKPVIKV